MILHPGVLALIIGSAITLLILLYATMMGLHIFYRWDFTSSSSGQLLLERKTYLISTLLNYALGFQAISIILFVYTLDDIHRLFVGAMCATGSLNANTVGWYGLLTKIALFFLAGFWVALNYIDQRSEEYPLVRLKYLLLVLLLPLVMADFLLQLSYFLGLDPDIITSCCGSLFGSAGEGTLSSLSALPVLPAMLAFYGLYTVFLGVAALNLYASSGVARLLLALVSAIFFVLAVVSIISFVSTYIYEMPTHHCPFDIVQREYNFIGYPLYLSLFVGVYFGMLPGLFQPLHKMPGLGEPLALIERSWVKWSIVCISLFMALVTAAVWISRLTYFQ